MAKIRIPDASDSDMWLCPGCSLYCVIYVQGETKSEMFKVIRDNTCLATQARIPKKNGKTVRWMRP